MSQEMQQPEDQRAQQQQQNQINPDQLTQEDQQTYKNIMDSITKMNSKLKKAKDLQSKNKNHQGQQAKQIAEKLITSKQNSQIITKQNLLTDVNESYEKVVVEVYSQNQNLKKTIKELQNIIKQQNQKINGHIAKQEALKKQNNLLKEQLLKLKDQQIIVQRQPPKNKSPQPKDIKKNQKKNQNTNEQYDFWSLPQNQSYVSKKKDLIQDSGLWANQKQIGQSMFITQEQTKSKKR